MNGTPATPFETLANACHTVVCRVKRDLAGTQGFAPRIMSEANNSKPGRRADQPSSEQPIVSEMAGCQRRFPQLVGYGGMKDGIINSES